MAALAAGFAGFDPRTPVAGVILNQVASDRHERLLRDALAGAGLPVYGVIRRTEGIVTPSRHLGLIPAAERAALAGQAIDRMGALVDASCDLDALLALAARACSRPGPAWSPSPATARTIPAPTIAIAGGAAFTFGYTEQAELLEAAGARVAPFDPLRDEDLPEGTAGLIVGGGFPELHAAGLSANERLRERVAALAARGAPVAAECAGLLYLARPSAELTPVCTRSSAISELRRDSGRSTARAAVRRRPSGPVVAVRGRRRSRRSPTSVGRMKRRMSGKTRSARSAFSRMVMIISRITDGLTGPRTSSMNDSAAKPKT